MKTAIITLICITIAWTSFGQVSFTITEPAAIASGYNFTSNGDGTDWGLADLLDPADAVLDTLMFVEDGSTGINEQGNPLSQEGCGPLINDLTGKIAVVYRYDGVSSNVCWYGTKALNAQNAGAVAVIMINREDALINVPGTTDGPSVTIPFVFISKSDGEAIVAQMNAGQDVVAFIGNKLGLYGDDAGIVKGSTIAPSIAATANQTALDNTEFGFDVGTQVYNYGNNDQTNVSVTATVTGAGGTWTETAGPFSILSGDTIDVFTGGTNDLSAFSFGTYPAGWYNLTYSIGLGTADESDFDNSLSFDFLISDSLISYVRLDPTTHLPLSNVNTRAAGTEAIFGMCINYDNPNGSRLAAEGMYFSAVTGYNSGLSLEGEEMTITLYRWEDAFTDLNDASLAFDNLTPLAYGFYYYPADLQDEVVFAEFDNYVALEDNQRFLACVRTSNIGIYMGHHNTVDYTRNIDHYLQPLNPNYSGPNYYALGFGGDLTPAIALQVFDAAELGTIENDLPEGIIYPNPAQDAISIRLSAVENATIIVRDISGKQVLNDHLINTAIKHLDISDLSKGIYTITLHYTDGRTSQFKFSK